MTDTLAPSTTASATLSSAQTALGVSWASPGEGLWVASRHEADGTIFLGFVEKTLDEYLVVDGEGTALGRFPDLRSAQAVLGADPSPAAPQRGWAHAGATVVPPSRLRRR